MKLVVGLGNPGEKYAQTRHNIGFTAIDKLGSRHGFQMSKTHFDAVYAEEFINMKKALFLKPMTYMNLSGRAVRAMADYFDISNEDIIILYDDVDLEVGQIRLRAKGSGGGQNGMKDIIDHLGTKEIKRIRIGIGRPYPNQSMTTHVLGRFPKEEQEDIQFAVNKACDAVEYWLEGNSFEETMTRFNG